jgi:hypothetical protein
VSYVEDDRAIDLAAIDRGRYFTRVAPPATDGLDEHDGLEGALSGLGQAG